jgi:sugar phosphate isomerase/epimerase
MLKQDKMHSADHQSTAPDAQPDLLACYWTLAGQYTFGDDDHSPWDFRDRVEAAARVGYTGFGIKQADLRRTLARHGYSGMRAILDGNGIRHLELEALFDWWTSGAARQRADADLELLLATAAELGASRIKAAGDFTGASCPLEAMHDAFQGLARAAYAVGTTMALEPIAFSSIPDIDTALAVIGASAGRGGGLMLDAWHVNRGQMSLHQIAGLPPGVLVGVELDDGTLEPVGTPIEDTLDRRRLCGEGEFDLAGLVTAARQAGYKGPWGVEIISAAHRLLPLSVAARQSFRTTSEVLRR